MINTFLSKNKLLERVCINSECIMTLINKDFLFYHCSNTITKPMDILVQVSRIGNMKYISDKYVMLDIYIPETLEGQKAITHIHHEAHIINKLNAKLLIGVDILAPENICINFSK